jgi:peroxiredoxin
MAVSTAARRLAPGDTVTSRQLVSISGESVSVPDPGQLVHLELRRFAGCPICNLHLRSVVLRKDELAAAGIKEVVVFHSTDQELRKYQTELPFAVIADPEKKLYAEFGVETSPRAVLNPRAWPAIVRGLGHSVGDSAQGESSAGCARERLARTAGRLPDRPRRADHRHQVQHARLRPVDGRRGARAGLRVSKRT